jgi:hypothetical protein
MFTWWKKFVRGYLAGRAMGTIARKRNNPMAAISLIWGSIFSDLKFNWGIRFVTKEVMEGENSGLEVNTSKPIFATIPKLCCVLVCLENLDEATHDMTDNEWAYYVMQGMAHEYRHAEQIEHFESVGLDSDYVFKLLALNYEYLESPIEKDAIKFSENLIIYSEKGCPKIHSDWLKVSASMFGIVDDIALKAQDGIISAAVFNYAEE